MVLFSPIVFAQNINLDIAQERSQINGDNKNKNKTISMTIFHNFFLFMLCLIYTIIIVIIIISRNNEWNYRRWK